ncbi:MAG: Gamma-glutamyl carboxylase-like protein, partial [Bacteroidetes bacterium]|nr:Gamma-glutamyl carboxylase-like protein [Bacteroidota bacterium]
MMTITVIFFREELHEKVLSKLKSLFRYVDSQMQIKQVDLKKATTLAFTVLVIVQLLLPFRYLLYKGDLFWTEQGYRFSWRVMLMEKAGTAFFFITDSKSGREIEIDNKVYLTYMQEKMMATQPDMMIDYAKFLKKEYEKKGFTSPKVRAQSYVTVNGCGSREFIDPTVDLSQESNSFFKNKNWVRSY